MPDLAIVAMSVVGSFIGAFVVAYTNNRFQGDREEIRILREKGELIISGLKTLSELYIEKYNYALECKKSDGQKSLRDSFGIETQTYNTMSPMENQIYALTQIYFPSCKATLDEWQGKLGYADGILREMASGQDVNEYDDLTKRWVDKSVSYISDIGVAASTLSKEIAQEIALARSISPYAEMKLALKALLEVLRNLHRRAKGLLGPA